MRIKKPKTELVDCAEALRKLSISAPRAVLEELIADGYYHLEELRAANKCNPILISSLDNRLKRAEDLLARKKELEAAS